MGKHDEKNMKGEEAMNAEDGAHEESMEGGELDRVKQLEAERDEAIAGWQRSAADFKNYQRRAMENETRAMASGSTKVVKGLMPVLDHFELALTHNPANMTTAQLAEAMGLVHDELMKALMGVGVQRVEPQPGDEFDPMMHTAVSQMPAEGVGPGKVAMTFQSGYVMGDVVLRPAKVAVTPSADGH